MFEARAQPSGNDVIIHHIGQRGDARRARDASGHIRLPRAKCLVAGTPEQRTGVMHGVPRQRVLQRRPIDMSCTRVPEPLAGGVGAGGSGAAAPAAEEGHRGCSARSHAARAQGADGEGGPAMRDCGCWCSAPPDRGCAVRSLALRGHPWSSHAQRNRTRGAQPMSWTQRAAATTPWRRSGGHRRAGQYGRHLSGKHAELRCMHVKGRRRCSTRQHGGVRRIVQLSALGAMPAYAAYFASRGRRGIRGGGGSTTRSCVLRWCSRRGPEHALVRAIGRRRCCRCRGRNAAGPTGAPAGPGNAWCVWSKRRRCTVVDAVGPQPLMLREYLDLFGARSAAGWILRFRGTRTRGCTRAGRAFAAAAGRSGRAVDARGRQHRRPHAEARVGPPATSPETFSRRARGRHARACTAWLDGAADALDVAFMWWRPASSRGGSIRAR